MKTPLLALSKHIVGFLNTPSVTLPSSLNSFDWRYHSNQFHEIDLDKIRIPKSKRLGHYVESFFIQYLIAIYSGGKILSNIQIQDKRQTFGELDVLILERDKLHHVEFCYKYYLFDPSLSNDELACWIGPNRNDSYLKKLSKLRDKQLPLLHNPLTIEKLATSIEGFSHLKLFQQVCFLAQLFVPYEHWLEKKTFDLGSPKGFYIKTSEILKNEFVNCMWLVTNSKLDWLSEKPDDEEWVNTDELSRSINELGGNWPNPICWMRNELNEVFKCFIVLWN